MTAELIARPGLRSMALALPTVPIAMASVVLVRLLFLTQPATPDEGGFLVVASQWHVGGTSLYGNYWVDRPPLLIGIFRLADLAGGLTALRVIGALAAAGTVGLLAGTARRAFGPRAATWTAVVAAALLVSPLLGAEVVNGELLAAPFIALGLRFAVEAAKTRDPLTARGAAVGTGLTAVLALLVKQNMADVVVFAAVCWIVAWRVRRLSGRTLADLVALAAVGFGVGYAVVMLWAMAHGTSPLGVYQATYPFRVRAGHVIAASTSDAAELRLSRLTLSFLLSAAPVVLVAFLALVRGWRRDPVAWGVVAAGTFATASIWAGGSYWLHYLVQSVPVTALAAGVVVARLHPRLGRWTYVPIALIIASTTAVTAISLAGPSSAPGSAVAHSLDSAIAPGDTMLSAFGDADILFDTGMRSPYPYLWSLPSRTLDPDMRLLRGILAGPEPPTWVVVRGQHTLARLADHGIANEVRARYDQVGEVCGRTIFLLRGVSRPALPPAGRCTGTVLP
jgi:hypothetical protein